MVAADAAEVRGEWFAACSSGSWGCVTGRPPAVSRARFRKKDRHARLGGGVHADAITGRIVHDAVRVETGETNMRQRLGGADRPE